MVGRPVPKQACVERLWRSAKYEEVYLKGYATLPEARRGPAWYVAFYDQGSLKRDISTLCAGKTPSE
jgi:putative transposase